MKTLKEKLLNKYFKEKNESFPALFKTGITFLQQIHYR